MCDYLLKHNLKSWRKNRSQFHSKWIMDNIKCVRTNPKTILNMLHASEKGPIDLRAMRFGQNRVISVKKSEKQIQIFFKYCEKVNRVAEAKRKHLTSQRFLSARASCLSAGSGWWGKLPCVCETASEPFSCATRFRTMSCAFARKRI